jgi:hypothetical protein
VGVDEAMVKLKLCVTRRVLIVRDVVLFLPVLLGEVVLAKSVANQVKLVLRTIHECV